MFIVNPFSKYSYLYVFGGWGWGMIFLWLIHTTFLFIFGKKKNRRGAHGKCLACEMFNFEIIYFAEAPAENAPPAKLYISKLYILADMFFVL